MNRYLQQITASAVLWTFCVPAAPAAARQASGESKLNIVIVEGQGAINNVRQRAGRDLTVEVQDAAQQPVAGASVTFTLPSQGASGVFFNGEKTLVATTDNQGKAVGRGFKPNSVTGKMEIRVSASAQGQTASATITQFNMAVQNPKSGGGNGKWIALLVVAGAAGAGGAVFATRRSGSSGTPTQPTAPAVITITPGAGTVGPPQ